MSPVSLDQCQRSSFKQCQLNIEKIQSNLEKKNTVLILPDKYSPIEICDNLKNDLFKAIFVFDNFDHNGQKSLKFNLIDRETPVKVIKKDIANYLGKKVSDIALAYLPTSAALKDDDNLLNTLNFHGLGGEVVHLRCMP